MDQVRFVTRVADARSDREERPVAHPLAPQLDRDGLIEVLNSQMRGAAAELDFELAAQLRDQLFELKAAGDAVLSQPAGVTRPKGQRSGRRRRSG